MTAGVLTLVDPEKTARDWARADAGISAAVGTKVFFSQPVAFAKAAMAAGTPYIIMTLVSQTFQPGDLGMQLPLMQWNCYGSSKAAAATVALAVETSVRLLTFGKPTAVGTSMIAWADATQARWLPDPTINAPRYILDVRFAIYGPQL